MFVNKKIILAANPFFDSYIHSDFMGKMIFIWLIGLSICSWIILLHKIYITYRARKHSSKFYEIFRLHKSNSLSLECENSVYRKLPNPFFDLYVVLKKHTLDLLNKNRRFGLNGQSGQNGQTGQTGQNNPQSHREESISYLSPPDLDFIHSHLTTTVAMQAKSLEKNLYILSTVVSLSPFLGLLGTVWGILTTFSEMQTQVGGSSHQMVLGGLSLALATTVLGLFGAIPALIAYNYLKNTIRDFETEMSCFSTELLASVEIQYRKVDLA